MVFDPTPIPTARAEMSTERELIDALRETNVNISLFEKRVKDHLREADSERSEIRKRLSKVESNCGVERTEIKNLTVAVRDLCSENKELIKSVSKMEGRQEGAISKWGKPAGMGGIFFLLLQLITYIISGGKVNVNHEQDRNRDLPTIQSNNR